MQSVPITNPVHVVDSQDSDAALHMVQVKFISLQCVYSERYVIMMNIFTVSAISYMRKPHPG